MRKFWVKILQILDGTPTANKQRRSGQSLLELALITPILIVLFSGMVEIGWFANNYLTLLDVTRAGARRAATLQDQRAPYSWDNNASYLPTQMLSAEFAAAGVGYMPYSSDPATADAQLFARSAYRNSLDTGVPVTYQSSGCGRPDLTGFYNDIACTMLSSLDPLSLDGTNGVDDIVVSGFSIDMINPADDETGAFVNQAWLGANRPLAGDVPQMVVVARYPTNANECDAVETAPGSGIYGSLEPRDPFDFNENDHIDKYSSIIGGSGIVYPYIWNDDFSEIDPGYDGVQGTVEQNEKQIGFVWFGQHRIEPIPQAGGGERETLCLGSEWTVAEIEQLINLTGYVPTTTPADRELLPGTGLVLVEIHWQHEMLLKLPVFNPVFNMLSPDGEPPEIYVWAAFPLPSTEPTILFQ
jgi:Flp pilus assembly protein TadG